MIYWKFRSYGREWERKEARQERWGTNARCCIFMWQLLYDESGRLTVAYSVGIATQLCGVDGWIHSTKHLCFSLLEERNRKLTCHLQSFSDLLLINVFPRGRQLLCPYGLDQPVPSAVLHVLGQILLWAWKPEHGQWDHVVMHGVKALIATAVEQSSQEPRNRRGGRI